VVCRGVEREIGFKALALVLGILDALGMAEVHRTRIEYGIVSRIIGPAWILRTGDYGGRERDDNQILVYSAIGYC
jgi:hypothetical protein